MKSVMSPILQLCHHNQMRDKRWDYKDKSARKEYNGCGRKKKLKSNEASRLADKWDQKKYECDVCGHWHLTKKRVSE